MEATAKGYEYAAEHPEEAADMLIAGVTLMPTDEMHSMAGFTRMTSVKSWDWKGRDPAGSDPQRDAVLPGLLQCRRCTGKVWNVPYGNDVSRQLAE